MALRHFVVLLIIAVALVLAAALRLLGGGITVREWRNAPAGADLDVVFDEPSHPPWNW